MSATPAVASVVLDVPLPHLDRVFDYTIPADFDEQAQPGVRVRVVFAGRLVSGVILARPEVSDFTGQLRPIRSLSGSERVLSPEVAQLCRAVADRWAGTFSDVLRLAVPPRHARVEREDGHPTVPPPPVPELGGWAEYQHGPAFLAHLARGESPRATWAALPGDCWAQEIAIATQAALSARRGAVIVVPDGREVARVSAALRSTLGSDHFVELTADLGPAERYRRFLRIVRGQVRAVVGTRAAAYAPVRALGLVVVWDDGSDLHEEPHAPYANVRDVLALRAHLGEAAALLGGHAPSVEAVSLAAGGWTHLVAASREVVRARAPRVEVAGSDEQLVRDPLARAARLPDVAFGAVRAALAAGHPVLVSVPRRGYRPALVCARCRTPLRCPACGGPLAQERADHVLTCRWCATSSVDPACPECGANQWRAVVVGDVRTADELGRAFPGVPVIRSSGAEVVAHLPDEPALVVATPGAEPVPERGYGAVLLLDAWALLGRADLRAGEEAVRRWMAAASLALPAGAGGHVVLAGAAPALPAVQALVRWDPIGYARYEADTRAELGFPPATRMAALEGEPQDLEAFLAAAQLPAGADVLGPVPLPGSGERLLVRVARQEGATLAAALQAVSRSRSVKSEPVVRVRLDPASIG